MVLAPHPSFDSIGNSDADPTTTFPPSFELWTDDDKLEWCQKNAVSQQTAKAIAQHAPTEVEPVVGADSVVLEICLGLRGCTSGLVEDGPSQSVCETICIAFGSPPSLRHRLVLLQHMNMRV